MLEGTQFQERSADDSRQWGEKKDLFEDFPCLFLHGNEPLFIASVFNPMSNRGQENRQTSQEVIKEPALGFDPAPDSTTKH
jgi:hypothetical protein